MTEPVDKQVAPLPVESDEQQQAKETVNRRRMFGAGILGIASMLAAACSGTDFASGNSLGSKKKKKQENGGEDNEDGEDGEDGGPGKKDEGGALDVEDGDDPSGPVKNDTGLDDCAANVTSDIDPNGDDIGSLKPRVKFYGRMDSALVAIKFPGSDAINQVILASPTGKMLAVHTITGADKDGSGNYRPIVMDNIWLKIKGSELKEIKIILQTPSGKKVHTEPVAFFTNFGGKTVIDLSSISVPAEMAGRQSVTQFNAQPTAFTNDPDVTYPNNASYNSGGETVRNLRTVNTSTTWTKGAGVMGTVTDIMGETIDIGGQGILEHQIFCTYVDVDSSKTVRTILHIG